MRTLFGWGIKLPVPKGLWQCVMPHGYFIRDKALNCDLFELGVKPLRLMAGRAHGWNPHPRLLCLLRAMDGGGNGCMNGSVVGRLGRGDGGSTE